MSAGVRPAPLPEGRQQGKLQRHAGIGYELVLALDAPVLQMVEQCLLVVAEQVIHVPKIILENIPSRRLCRDPQLAEQLVEVPTIASYSWLQLGIEHNVDIAVPSGGGRRGRKRRTRLWPKLQRRPGQSSTVFHGAEHQDEESEEEVHEGLEYCEYHGRFWGSSWVRARHHESWWLAAADGSKIGPTLWRPPWLLREGELGS